MPPRSTESASTVARRARIHTGADLAAGAQRAAAVADGGTAADAARSPAAAADAARSPPVAAAAQTSAAANMPARSLLAMPRR